MTTKILTVRIPAPIYATLCADAGALGVPVSSHIRRLIEREHQAEQISNLRVELLNRLDNLPAPVAQAVPAQEEILLLSRAIAAQLNPQLVAQVRAKLAQSGGVAA